jgi:uncharacterized protein YcaQ
MCYAGLAIVHHKKGTRRYYALAERFVPAQYRALQSPYETDEEYYTWAVLRRINGTGILWNKPSDAWLGINGLKSEQRNAAFRALLQQRRIAEVDVLGMAHPLYIAVENLDLLHGTVDTPVRDGCARILAPLDNLLWDRRLISDLFGFDYKWEVYTPVPERKYGYYVLPILCGSRFVGRIEMETDAKQRTLVVNNVWFEPGIDVPAHRESLLSGLDRFATYNLSDHTEIRCAV